ncbi:MAG: hypothetical protein M1275_03960 [Patescibacteria group bacterium]|nr:hypothetical protein [Patescibacteria group bacterium]
MRTTFLLLLALALPLCAEVCGPGKLNIAVPAGIGRELDRWSSAAPCPAVRCSGVHRLRAIVEIDVAGVVKSVRATGFHPIARGVEKAVKRWEFKPTGRERRKAFALLVRCSC